MNVPNSHQLIIGNTEQTTLLVRKMY